jgi:hypothetical protein
MSRRYECGRAAGTPISVLSGREAVEEQVLYASEAKAGEHALIIGDPYASAYAVTGTPAQLREFTAKLTAFVAGLAGETEAGKPAPIPFAAEPDWYDPNSPDPQFCPSCRDRQHCNGGTSFCECSCTEGDPA